MKKNIYLTVLLLVMGISAFAQDRKITGTVTSSKDNSAIPGATVVIKGTTKGSVTDVSGRYEIMLTPGSNTLVFSFVGMKKKEVVVGASDAVNVALDEEATEVGEVVVTALGVKREAKSLGYATQSVTGEDISKAKESNFINSLQGKVAGVQISGSSNMGGSSRILLRGVRSIQYENQPLFVVDGVPVNNGNFATRDQVRGAIGYDYGNAAQDINPDDIESINVLKGSAATALYGSQGANGVIIITTKKGVAREKGSGRSPIGVSITSGIQFSKVFVLPKYQNKYGGGASSDFVDSDLHPGELRSNFEYDGSWGPEMLGQQVYQWDSYYESMPNYNKAYGWTAHPDNIKDFFETGIATNNTIAVDGGNENASYRLGYTNYNETGTFPNSSLLRNIFSFNGSNKFSNKLTSTIGINYVKQSGKARPQTGYSNLSSNFTQWWQRQIDMKQLEDYKNPDGTQRTWNINAEDDLSPLYWDNPYWTQYENYETDQRNRLYGYIGLNYEFTPHISLSGAVKTDYYNDNRQERTAIGSASISRYAEENIFFNENNYELILRGQTALNEDFDLSGFVGVNRQDRTTEDNLNETQGGLNVPNFYSLTNSADNVLSTPKTTVLRRNSAYASVSLGYKRFLYLDVTGRNEWSSTLPSDNSSYFYPSATASFVFSEKLKAKWLTYGKLRAGWAQTAIDPIPYASGTTRPVVTSNFDGYATAISPNTANNEELMPEKTTSWEIGTEMKFLNNRLSLDFTYYNSLSKDVIFPVQQSSATGVVKKNYNAAEISNKGIELSVKGTVVQTPSGFEWGLGLNFAKNDNMVEKLFVDENGNATESLLLENAPFAVTFQARPGYSFGQIVGYDYAYDANGNHIIDPSTHAYARTAKVVPLGSVLPDFTGGVSTWVSFKGFQLTALVDFQSGGNLFSLTNTWGKYSGTLAETADNGIRENGIVLEGVVQTGVDANGEPISTGEQNHDTIAAVDHFFLDGGYTIGAADVYDASYIKFRELTLTYALPAKMFEKCAVQGLSIAFTVRNLAILSKNIPNIDPEAAVSTNNIQGLEGGQLPSTRTYGVSLSLRF